MSNELKSEYPKELLVPIEDNPFQQVRVTIYQSFGKFHADIDLILLESGKILSSLGNIFNQESEQELLSMALKRLSDP